MRDLETRDAMPAAHQAVTLQLSNELVRLYKELFGRGPSSARTDFAGRDCVVVSLEQSLTPAERSMVAMGEQQRLRETRLIFQYAREKDFRETAERIIGRRVRAFVSGIDVEQDIATEVFYLERAANDQDGEVRAR